MNGGTCADVRRSDSNFAQWWLASLAIGGAVLFDDPTGFGTECFQDLVVVAVFGEFVVSLSSETGVNLSGNGSSPSLSPLVVLSLLPCRQPSR